MTPTNPPAAAAAQSGFMRRMLAIGSLIVAGEAVFIPPFHLGRYFKSSFLETFGITELELGEAQAIYGIVAMASYVLGGPIADRFAPRVLLTVSLLLTAVGSLYMATVPGLLALKVLMGFWGASTVLVFWSPLIRATREWGGEPSQGVAFGLLDSGRGGVAWVVALVASTAVAISLSGPGLDDPEQQRRAMQGLSVFYSVLCVVAAACVWAFVGKGHKPTQREEHPEEGLVADTLWALRQPTVWLQATVVICAYSAYKGFSFFGLYLEDAAGVSKADSSQIVTWISLIRFFAPFAAGVLADRIGSVAGVVAGCFVVEAVCFGWLVGTPAGATAALVVGTIAAASAAAYAMRGVYFALLQESNVPRRVTGAAVGIISFVGFTPDIFMPWVSGYLVTSARESGDVMAGYESFWSLLCGFAVVGFVAAVLLRRRRPAE